MTHESEWRRHGELMAHINELKTYYRIVYKFTSFGQLRKDKEEREAWCEQHCKDLYYGYFNMWYFKDEQDYLMFMLRWSK